MRSALSVKRSSRMTRRWRTIAILAVGVALGTMLTATPVYSHVGGTVTHLWTKHIMPKADVRYANAVPGTDKARDADQFDGRDSSGFAAAFDYDCGPGQFLRRAGSSISVKVHGCAGDAENVDGQSATTFNFNVAGTGSIAFNQLFTFNGLRLRARCSAATDPDSLHLEASTDMDDSYIRSDIAGAPADPDWDVAEGNPAGGSGIGDTWFVSNEDKAGTFVYRRGGSTALQGQVTSVTLAWDTTTAGCDLAGTVIGH